MLVSRSRFQTALARVDSRLLRLERDLEGIETRLQTIARAQDELASTLGAVSTAAEMSAELKELRKAVALGIEHVERTEARIRATVGRAKKELERHGVKHPGLDAEAEILFEGNGDGSEEEGVLPLHPSMAVDALRSVGIPGRIEPEDLEAFGL